MSETKSRAPHLSPKVRNLLEGMQKELNENGTIPISIFNDKDLHQAEMEQIFGKQWNYIGHESEIPKPGDYVLRYVGHDPFIFVRDEDDSIRVLFDACRHRGVQLCRAEKGNTSHFRCPYHGWTYKNTGELIGAPGYKKAYQGMDKSEWGLIPAPRMENYHGFVFISLEREGPGLEEALGDFAWYLEMMFTMQTDGMEVLGEPQKFIVNCNWKQFAENFGGDDYHLLYLHRSTFDAGVMQIPLMENMKGYHIKPGKGHGVSFSIDLESDEENYWMFPPEIVESFDGLKNMTKDQQEFAKGARVTVGNIFPNTSFLLIPLSPDPEEVDPTTFLTWRVWRPLGPDKVEVVNWFFMYKNVPEEYKKQAFRAGLQSFGMAGTFEMDDAIPLESIARVANSVFGKKELKLNYQMGMDGIGESKVVEDWPFPGEAWYPRFEEGNQRQIYQHYLDVMLNNQ